MKKDADIIESAYFYNEETDVYEALCIIENNTLNPLESGMVAARAYDAEGNRIESVKDGPYDYNIIMSYYGLAPGERTALLKTNAGSEGEEDAGILSHYKAVPASLEWENDSGFTRADPNLLPIGLSVANVEDLTGHGAGYGEYRITLKNDSETDYVYNYDDYAYHSDSASFMFHIVSVCRDAEGAIKDVEWICFDRNSAPDVISAGSETEMYAFSYNRCEDDSLTKEYYLHMEKE